MFFKLQKEHRMFSNAPEDIHGIRVRRIADRSLEAELTIAFQHDPSTGLFHLFAKRKTRSTDVRYDLLATAKVNSVWHIGIHIDKRRRMISAELTDTKGNQEIVALTYHHLDMVSLETLLPVEEAAPSAQVEEIEETRKGTYTLKLWHQYGRYLKKVVAARKIK